MKLTGSEGVVNEWNMVGGYYDLLYRLLHHYYESSLTPGVVDDIETLKRFIDHASCKLTMFDTPKLFRHVIVFKDTKNSKKPNGYMIPIVEYLDGEVRAVERVISQYEAKKNSGSVVSKKSYRELSLAKKDLRSAHRIIMKEFQRMGDFNKNRLLRGKKAAFAQFGGMEDEQE